MSSNTPETYSIYKTRTKKKEKRKKVQLISFLQRLSTALYCISVFYIPLTCVVPGGTLYPGYVPLNAF
jgi:hypothetical protein